MKATALASFTLVICTVALIACASPKTIPAAAPPESAGAPAALPEAVEAAAAFDHSAYDKLLKKHVNEKGLVNYKGWKADQKEFNDYLARLSKTPRLPNGARPNKWPTGSMPTTLTPSASSWTITPCKASRTLGQKFKFHS